MNGEHLGNDAHSRKEISPLGTIVIKIGGSTMGNHDTTLEDVVEIQRQGFHPVIVHGGGNAINEWMHRQGLRPRFVRGLRVTDPKSLDVVVSVLSGLVNKGIVGSIQSLGGKAVGLSGVDGGMLQANILDPELGMVGKIVSVDTESLQSLLKINCVPVIAPIAVHVSDSSKFAGSLLNVNADTVAGDIALALGAKKIVFMTDVDGVLDSSRRLISRLTTKHAKGLIQSRVVGGGMIPKIEACLKALEQLDEAHIVNGQKPHSLKNILDGQNLGTQIG